jgi:hypothetical protein
MAVKKPLSALFRSSLKAVGWTLCSPTVPYDTPRTSAAASREAFFTKEKVQAPVRTWRRIHSLLCTLNLKTM